MSNNPPRTVKKHQIKTKRMKQLYVLLFFCLSSVINANAKENTAPLAPAATITGGTTVCQNAASPLITFTGSGGTAPYTFTYTVTGVAGNQTISTTGNNSTITIPANTSSSGTFTYNLVSVEDSSDPVQVSNVTGNTVMIIRPQANADLSSSADFSVFNGFPTYRVCTNQPTQIDFNNASSTLATNTNYSINWGDGSPNFTGTTWTSLSHTYQVGLWTLTYTISAQNGCNITKIYKVFVGNNPAVGLENPGNTDVCITSSLTFPITGTENNPPGTTYVVTFNDNSPATTFNHPPPSSITHTFLDSSCGTTSVSGPTTYTNSFFANIIAVNPCDQSSAMVVPIRISDAPEAEFSLPQQNICVGSQACFTNTSTGGDAASSTGCTSPKLIWIISPNVGFSLASGSLGNDFNSTNTNSWVSGSTNICPVFSVAGNYTITLKIGNRCGIDTITKTICVQPQLTPQFTLNTTSGCTPLAVTATNNTSLVNQCATPSYQWSVAYSPTNCGTSITPIPNQTTQNASFNFTEPGNYTITLTTTNSCGSTTTSQTVTVKKPPTVSINPINDVCGAATITPVATVNSCAPTGSTLTYAWSFPGGTPATSSAVNPGAINFPESPTPYTITLTVTNECGISNTASETFSVNTAPTITTTNLSQTICSGTATTLVNLTANPSTATINWSATATAGVSGFATSGTNTIPVQTITTTSTTVGTVTYTITPTINGCNGTPVNYVITVNPAPVMVTNPVNSNICFGQTPTQLSVSYNNGSGTPVYEWFSNTTNSNSGGTPIPSSNAPTYDPPAGTVGTVYYYCVITFPSLTGSCSFITSTAAEVTIVDSATITTPNQPLATQTLCVGATIPTPLTVTPTGGIGTPTYQWYSNTNNTTTGGTPVGSNASSYTPPVFTATGTYYYYVVISYTNGCGNLTSTVAQIDVVSDPTITTQPLASQTVCQSETATQLSVTATGGIGTNYSYQWYSDTNNDSANGTLLVGETNNTFTPSTTNAGTFYYYCVITQPTATGCNATSAAAMITVNVAPAFTTTLTSSIICLGQSPPQSPSQLVIVTNSDALSPNYQWYSNTTNSNSGGTLLTGENNATFNPPATTAGTTYYYCVVTFPTIVGTCSEIKSDTAEVIINQNPIIGPETATICSTTSFSITPTTAGGNIIPTGTTYTWSTPTVNPVGAITNATAETNPQTVISQNLINTTTNPATVTYTVTPKSGTCIGTNFLVTITVNPAINPNVVATNNTCFNVDNASITTNITGGIPPYTITWTGPNSFSSSATNIQNIEPGNYDLTITDTGNCPFTSSYTITEPNDIVITTDSSNNITCFGANNGSIGISVTGGTGTYTYNWTKDTFPFAATDDISNLAPGVYLVTVSDANNCGPKTATFTITEPPVLQVNLVSQTNVDCFGFSTGAINAEVIGGTSPYTYAWSNGETTEDITAIPAGLYNLVVTDSLGCSQNLSVTITQSPEIIINAITTPIVCYGDNNATIDVTISGGVAPYLYQWSNLATSLNLTNLAPDDYIITVTDGIGCIKVLSINIPSPPIFDVAPVVSNISCFGANDGSINLNFVGGIAPVNLVWSDGSTSGTSRNNLPPGIYSVVITDSKPCTISRTFTIVEPAAIVLSANVTNPLDCTNGSSGAIDLIIAGGTLPYSFLWTNGATTEDVSGVTAGNYGVTLTDANGCSTSKTYTLIRPAPLEVAVTTQTDANCTTRIVNQSFVAQASGGVPPYQYQWSSGNISGTNNEIMSTPLNGIVIVTATDAIGCTTTFSVDVNNPVIGTASFEPTSIGIINYGMFAIGDPIQFESTITGDYISVLWDFGDGTFSTEVNPIHTYLNVKDSYTVTQTVTYPFGCVYTQQLEINVEKGYILVVPTAFTPNGDTKNDTYKPVTKALKNIQLDIYDTWGSLIYSEKGEVLLGWDGKIKGVNAENGNYYSKVSAETFYGSIINQNQTFVLIK